MIHSGGRLAMPLFVCVDLLAYPHKSVYNRHIARKKRGLIYVFES